MIFLLLRRIICLTFQKKGLSIVSNEDFCECLFEQQNQNLRLLFLPFAWQGAHHLLAGRNPESLDFTVFLFPPKLKDCSFLWLVLINSSCFWRRLTGLTLTCTNSSVEQAFTPLYYVNDVPLPYRSGKLPKKSKESRHAKDGRVCCVEAEMVWLKERLFHSRSIWLSQGFPES
jgi:hypothetical protein